MSKCCLYSPRLEAEQTVAEAAIVLRLLRLSMVYGPGTCDWLRDIILASDWLLTTLTGYWG